MKTEKSPPDGGAGERRWSDIDSIFIRLLALGHLCAMAGALAVSKETKRMEQSEQGNDCGGNGCEGTHGCPECAAVVKLLRFLAITVSTLATFWFALALFLIRRFAG